MAFPTILVNSTGGAAPPSASGAGPTTALTGTNASYSGSVVTLDGSPSLTNVVTDGSHVLYLNTSTGRKFFAITAKGGSTVTVADAPAGTTTGRSWAIGGKLSSVTGANAWNLLENAGATGDAKGGWAVEMQSGHVETASGDLNPRANGDTTGGQVILRGAAGAATMPILNISGDNRGIIQRGNGVVFRDFAVTSTGPKTSSSLGYAITGLTSSFTCIGLVINSSTSGNKWYNGFAAIGGPVLPYIVGCKLDTFTGDAIKADQSPIVLVGNNIRDCGGYGVNLVSSNYYGVVLAFNAFDTCALGDFYLLNGRADTLGQCLALIHNTHYDPGGSAILLDCSNANKQICRGLILNEVFSSAGAYNVSIPNVTGAGAAESGLVVLGCVDHAPSSGAINPAANTRLDAITTDPAFTSAAGGNLTPTAAGLQTAIPNPHPGGA